MPSLTPSAEADKHSRFCWPAYGPAMGVQQLLIAYLAPPGFLTPTGRHRLRRR